MNRHDNDIVKDLRTAILRLNEAERALAPLRDDLKRAEREAGDAGLSVEYPGFGTAERGREQPIITRTTRL